MVNKLFNLFKTAIKHELISGSLFIFIGTTIASIFSFLLNLFLARNLAYGDYGTFSSLISLYTLATIPASSLTVVVVQFATGYLARNEIEKANEFYKKMILVWGGVGALIILTFTLFSGLISHFLHLNDHSLIFLIGLSVSLSYVGVVNVGFLQSMTRFSFMSVVYVIGAFVRLIIGVILVILGYKVFGGVVALFIMALTTFTITFLPLRKFFFGKDSPIKLSFKEVGKYALPSLLTILFLSSFISTDVILAKHFLSAKEAGLYGGIALVGKVIFYFTGPIPVVMFPLLVKKSINKEKFDSILYLALVLVGLPSIAITIFYYLFPGFTINLFLAGREYLSVGKYLGLFGIFLTTYSLLNVLVNFFLSIKNTRIFMVVGLGALLQIILISINHKSFNAIIDSSIFSSSLILIFLLLYYIYKYKLPRPK